MNKNTIAIIEDDNILANVLKEAFEDAGFSVLQASDGEEGLKLMESNEIDLILLDILLPKMNGIELLKKIRANEKLKNIEIIILSVVSDMGKIADAMEGGVYTYLIKDKTRVENLVEMVKEKLSA